MLKVTTEQKWCVNTGMEWVATTWQHRRGPFRHIPTTHKRGSLKKCGTELRKGRHSPYSRSYLTRILCLQFTSATSAQQPSFYFAQWDVYYETAVHSDISLQPICLHPRCTVQHASGKWTDILLCSMLKTHSVLCVVCSKHTSVLLRSIHIYLCIVFVINLYFSYWPILAAEFAIITFFRQIESVVMTGNYIERLPGDTVSGLKHVKQVNSCTVAECNQTPHTAIWC